MRWLLPALTVALLIGATLVSAQTLEASKKVTALGVVRYDMGTSDNGRDDLFVLDVDDNNKISERDIVLATNGFANTEPGKTITSSNNAVIGKGKLVAAHVVYADADGSGSYNKGDWVYISGFSNKLSTTKGDSNDYSIRITATDNHEKWSIVVTGDSDFTSFRDSVSNDLGGGSGDGSFSFVDEDNDGLLDVGEDGYILPDTVSKGAAIPSTAILITATDAPNNAPEATLTASVTEGHVPLSVTFTIDASDADGDDLSWELDADGDGTVDASGTELPAEEVFEYDATGTFEATLTVDDGEDTATATVSVTVSEAATETTTTTQATTTDPAGGATDGAQEPVPGPAVVLIVVALAVASLVRRRF